MAPSLVKPRTPPGVLELLPGEQLAFQHMLDVIRRGFERFGFLPVETPAFELTEVLLTKEGGETEKQVYFVQSTGALKEGHTPELALRFDLTVPLARYVAQHENELNFPFRRYQIQRVYRGERNQKGRFREFYQCDIDVVGKDSLGLAYDAEVPAVIYGVFKELGFEDFTIYFNNRKLLKGLLGEVLGLPSEQHAPVLHEIDRLGKSEPEEVKQRLMGEAVALPETTATKLLEGLTGPMDGLVAHFGAQPSHAVFHEGLTELKTVHQTVLALGVPAKAAQVKLSIVRGLDYYTGTVYETFLDAHPKLGSICSGGRYDNLAGLFTKSKLPGVGISIGATRLFDQLREVGLLKGAPTSTAQVVIMRVEPGLALDYAQMASELRQAGLNVDVYGGDDKLGKQFKYADKAKVPLGIIVGGREREAGQVKVKDLRVADRQAQGKEVSTPRAELVATVKRLLASPNPAP